MRLPSDAALIVIDEATADAATRTAIAALLAVWREEGLPVLHVRDESEGPAAAPSLGEPVIRKRAGRAFAGEDLEAALDAIGATTLVVCGAFEGAALEATMRDAASLGYRVFVVADAGLPVDAGAAARVVTLATALEAGRRAKARQRWRAARSQAEGGA